ncbi:hypothetical protein, partial [Salinisphaera sp. G21_0]|uniref:hypothetical protein n=1 Tax=Salinisphaera sp. G21_0 TaxID=2821094 RepID=UPI001ADCBB37
LKSSCCHRRLPTKILDILLFLLWFSPSWGCGGRRFKSSRSDQTLFYLNFLTLPESPFHQFTRLPDKQAQIRKSGFLPFHTIKYIFRINLKDAKNIPIDHAAL